METILIADDDAATRDMLTDFLSEEGYSPVAVGNAAEMLAYYNEHNPDLVLMDIRLPDRSGLEILKDLKLGRNQQKPVVAMTAFGGSGVAIEAMRLGAYDYITKPFDLDHVSQVLKRYFDYRHLSDQVAELTELVGRSDASDPLIGNSPAM